MRRVIFVNRFYWPDVPATGQLLTDLASELARQGWNVTVITGAPTNTTHPQHQHHRGVAVERVRTPRPLAGNVTAKGIAFLAFSAGAIVRLLLKARRGDIVVTMTDPPLLGVLTGVACGLKGARAVHWIQDIYPEIAITLSGHRWLGVLKWVRNGSWRSAHRCIALSSEMADVVRAAGVPASRVMVIPNWAPAGLGPRPRQDPAVQQLRKQLALDDAFAVVYSGNLGRVHDLMPVLQAADHLRHNHRVRIVFIGSGAQHKTLAAWAKERGLENVSFLPPQPRDQLECSLAIADVHLVTLRRGCEAFVFPSKFYGIVAVGRPVVFVGPPQCELASLVREQGIGIAVDGTDPIAIASALETLASNPRQVDLFTAAATRHAATVSFAAAADKWQQQLALIDAC